MIAFTIPHGIREHFARFAGADAASLSDRAVLDKFVATFNRFTFLFSDCDRQGVRTWGADGDALVIVRPRNDGTSAREGWQDTIAADLADVLGCDVAVEANGPSSFKFIVSVP